MMLLRFLVFAVAAAALAGCNMGGGNGNASNLPSSTKDQADLAANATSVLQKQMARPPQKRIPEELVADARCIAVFPQVTEAGLVVGGYHGEGLISCRQQSGSFASAAPAIYSLSGASFGLQAGAQQNTLILLFMTRQAAESLFQSKLKLGSQVGITAGPVGFNRSITGGGVSPIVSYITNKKGLFGGVNLNGTKMGFDGDMNAPLYGPGATPQGVLVGKNTRVPSVMTMYVNQLQRFTPGAPANQGTQQGMRQGSQGMQQQGSGMRQQGSGMQRQGSGMRQQGSGMQQQGSGMRQQGSSSK